MDVWEKLFELLLDMPFGNSTEEAEQAHAENVVEYLIANGVTVQEWISVIDRLPEDWALCACVDNEVRILCYDYIMDDWDICGMPNSCYSKPFVTHWMPLPQPPKAIAV